MKCSQGAAAATPYAEGAGADVRAGNGINAHVKFILRDGRDWAVVERISINTAVSSTSSAAERVAEAHTSKRRFLFNTTLRSLAPSECFNAVVGDGSNVVPLIPEGSINIDHAFSTSVETSGMNVQGLAEFKGWQKIPWSDRSGLGCSMRTTSYAGKSDWTDF